MRTADEYFCFCDDGGGFQTSSVHTDIVCGSDYVVSCDVPFRKYFGKTTFDGYENI